ncbi:MAG TPA: branched-chain amino acid ABC transporter permease [Burkholderiales bacterium]
MADALAYLHFVVVPQVIDGLIIGVTLALVALGLTMIFGLLHVINLAHGELYMLGGYAALALIGWGSGYWGALVLVPLLVGLAGWGLEELGIRPLMPRPDRAIVTLLLTFGVSLMLRDAAQIVWGTQTYSIEAPLTGVVEFGGVFLPTYRLLVLGVGVGAIAVTWWLLYRTRLGAVLRATAADPAMVASLGIPVRWVYAFTFVFGCALAGLAGVLLSPIYAVFPTMGHDFLIMAFAVVIVGGMGSLFGAVLAALLLAQVHSIASLWIPPVWAQTLVFVVMLLVLIVRPAGLFARLGKA